MFFFPSTESHLESEIFKFLKILPGKLAPENGCIKSPPGENLSRSVWPNAPVESDDQTHKKLVDNKSEEGIDWITS